MTQPGVESKYMTETAMQMTGEKTGPAINGVGTIDDPYGKQLYATHENQL